MSNETEMPEEWRDIVGYEGKYKVSDQGRIWGAATGRNWKSNKTPPVNTKAQGDSDNKTIRELAAALQKNYDTFCRFAKLHAAKDTDEGSRKAHRNLDHAAEIRKALKTNAPRIAEAQEDKG